METKEILKVIKKLNGKIKPTSCYTSSYTSNRGRLERLKRLIDLTGMLLANIEKIYRMYKDSHETEISEFSNCAGDFLKHISKKYNIDNNEQR
ncbi:MAG: hypothetical protein ACRC0V_05735 [Fusobacteriaceae bacterium]